MALSFCVSGDMGGYLGLLIGASVLTVCEVLDLIIYNSIVKLTRTGKSTKKDPADNVKI